MTFQGIEDVNALQHRLKKEHVQFKSVREAIRREYTLKNLEHRPLGEIAAHLGYSELASLNRAFRHWTGVSLSKYCKGVRNRGSG